MHERISFARSVVDSDRQLHLLGFGLPPNVSQSAIIKKVIPLIITWVSDFVAVLPFKCCLRYADFQLILVMNMFVDG